MIAFDEAISRMFDVARPLGREFVSIQNAAGRILSSSVIARADMPAQNVSMMDGYAVRGLDLGEIPFSLPISGDSFAGSALPGAILPGTMVRIFTGAPVPEGADYVIIQENVERQDDTAVVHSQFGPNRFIRMAGSDFRKGDVLLFAGHKLNWRAMTTAAAADRDTLEVFRRPKISILATGDELAAPGHAHERAGAIPESVTLGVQALAQNRGAEIVHTERLPDDLDRLMPAAGAAAKQSDIVVVIGGASVGEKDFSRAMFGNELDYIFQKVAIKPGKPVWLARVGGTLVLGLPGNPTSALVTARLFLAPLIVGLAGGKAQDELQFSADICADPIPETSGRETFLRASLNDDGLKLSTTQNSASQRSLAFADVLIRRRPNAPAAPEGEHLEVLPF